MEIAYLTDIGTHRQDNQDQVGAYYNQAKIPLVMVADGVASNAGSRLASQLVIEELGSAWQETILDSDQGIETWLYEQVERVNQLILDCAKKQPDLSEMATTLVLAVVINQRVLVANVGDSKAYRWHGGNLEQLSFDHTLKNELARKNGQEYASTMPNANSLTRYLGVNQRVNLEIHWSGLLQEDILFLTSDGIPKALSKDQMAGVIDQVKPVPELVKDLIEQANRQGASDNITAFLLKQ